MIGPVFLRGLGLPAFVWATEGCQGNNRDLQNVAQDWERKHVRAWGEKEGKRERERERKRGKEESERGSIRILPNLNLFFHMGLQLLPVPSQPLPPRSGLLLFACYRKVRF